MAKADSLKETLVKYPYLFGSQGLSVPRSYLTGGAAAESNDDGPLTRKKAISSECLHLMSVTDAAQSRDSSREGWYMECEEDGGEIYECMYDSGLKSRHSYSYILFIFSPSLSLSHYLSLFLSLSFLNISPFPLPLSLLPLFLSFPPLNTHPKEIKPFSVWWSSNRIDYSLESSHDLDVGPRLPLPAVSHVIHSRYWEAKELVSFILRQV